MPVQKVKSFLFNIPTPREMISGIVIPSIGGLLANNNLSAYWIMRPVNFGDMLTPLVLKHYGFTPFLCPRAFIGKAQVLSIGSILQWAPQDYVGHVLGSGLIEDVSRPFPQAKFWAVRGHLTKERVNAPEDTVLGDPGLLSAKLIEQRQSRKYLLGILPHFRDKQDPRIALIQQRYKDDVKLIDPQRDPSLVFEDIDQCGCILSSSLHGIIVADSLNIPSAWLQLSDKVRGKGFKFYDYFSSIGIESNPVSLVGDEDLTQLLGYARMPPAAISEVVEKLDDTFRSFKSFMKEGK